MPSYGRFHEAEAPSTLLSLHLFKGETLREVDHEPKVGVLDQQDLFAQGIDTSKLVQGAQRVNSLGSCTANANVSALSNVLPEDEFLHLIGGAAYTDVVQAECFAITFYAACTHQTATPAQEWPPTDCGSSGPYVAQEDTRLELIGGQQIAHGAQNLVSLLQGDGVLEGTPFLNAWEDPPSNCFVDGDGSYATLEEQIEMGVAGGHETYISAIEKLTLGASGQVVPEQTVLRVRNSWSKTWGDNGSFYIHLSTLVALGQYSDFRQLQPR